MDYLAEHIGWMAWTWQTIVFFASIAVILVIMTLLAVYRPETPHVGILGFATTRSDRLFVSLLATAFVFRAVRPRQRALSGRGVAAHRSHHVQVRLNRSGSPEPFRFA